MKIIFTCPECGYDEFTYKEDGFEEVFICNECNEKLHESELEKEYF